MSAMKTKTTYSGNIDFTNPDATRRRLNRMHNTLERARWITISIIVIAAICLTSTVLAFSKYGETEKEYDSNISYYMDIIDGLEKGIEDRDKVIAQKNNEIGLYQDDIVTVVNEYNKLYNDFTAMTDMNVELTEKDKEIAAQANVDNTELNDLRHRAELYEKYNYSIINSMDQNLPEDQKRTDITYDQIATLEELAKENGLSEDAVSLVLAIAMNESRGNEDAKNPNSTATGYCGILNTTGRYLYEDLMGNEKGSYNHDMCYNGYINLELSLQYIKYLNDMYGGDVLSVVNGYRGYYDAAYDSQLDANLQKAGKSLYTLHLSAE